MSLLGGSMGDGATIGDVIIRARADTSGLKRDLASATTDMKAAGQKWSAIAQVTKVAFMGIAAGVVGFAATGVMAAAKFNASMANIYAMTGQTAEGMQKIRKQVLDMSLEVPQSAKELGDAFYYIASAGIAASDAADVLKASAMAATAGQTGVQTVADGLTSVMNAYALAGKDAIHVTDVLTQTIISGKSEWADLAKAIGPVAVYAKIAGIDIEQLGAAIATLTQVGFSAQGASDALKGALRSLAAPTQQQWKTFKLLGIQYNTNWLKTKGLIGTLKEFEKSIGKIITVQIKNKNGTVNLNASLAATEKINRGAFDRWKKLTGGAHGFMLAQVLLNKHGDTYNGILKEMYASQGKTVETFKKTKQMDPSTTFAGLKNVLMKYAIELGTELMPKILGFLDILTVAVPKAFEAIASVLTSTVLPAVSPLVDAFGRLFGALTSALFGSGGMGSAKALNPLQMFGDAFAQVAKMITTVIDVLGKLASNPAVALFIKVAAAATAMSVAFKTMSGLSGSLNRLFSGLASSLTGGRLGGKGVTSVVTPESKALMGSATALDKSAVALGEAAGMLAAGGIGGGLGGGIPGGSVLPMGGRLRPIGAPALPGTFVTLGSEEAKIQKAAFMRQQSAMQAYTRGLAQPMLAEERALANAAANSGKMMLRNATVDLGMALTGGLGEAKGLLSKGLGFVSKAFWPLMIADIALEFLKAPIGGLLEENTDFKRAGALMKQDFFGGLVELFTKSMQGGDAAVGRSEFMTIGNVKFKTLSLAKIGITNATFDLLEAPVGSIQNALGQVAASDAGVDSKKVGRLPGEAIAAWTKRVFERLPADVQAQVSKAIEENTVSTGYKTFTITPAGDKAVADLINGWFTGSVSILNASREALLSGDLGKSLQARGFTAGQIAKISTANLRTLGEMTIADAEGTLGFMRDYLVRKYSGAIQKSSHVIDENKIAVMIGGMTKQFGDNWEAKIKEAIKNPDTKSGKAINAWMLKNFDANWQSMFVDAVVQAHPSIPEVNATTTKFLSELLGDSWASIVKSALANPTSKDNAPLVALLSKRLGKNWKEISKGAIDQLGPSHGQSAPDPKIATTLTEQLKATLLAQREQVVASIARFNQSLPAAQADALGTFVSDTKTAISPEIQASLKKKFGNDWLVALRAGTDGIADGSAIALEFTKVFGPEWRTAVMGFGQMLFQSQGGEDSLALARALADAISKEIASLTPDTLNAPDKTHTRKSGKTSQTVIDSFTAPLTPAQETAAKKLLGDKIATLIKDGVLAATASPDTKVAGNAIAAIGLALQKAIPDEAARNRFVAQLVAIEKASAVPSGETIAASLASVLPTIATGAAAAAGQLSGVLLPALMALFNMTPTGPTATTPVDKTKKYRFNARGGPVFKDTPTWVGEYGKELFVPGANGQILTNKLSMMLAGRSRAQAAQPTQRAGQTIYVDRLQMFSDGDRAQVQETLHFLSPAGR